MIGFAKRALRLRRAEQIFEQISKLAEVVALEYQPVGLADGGTATAFQDLSASSEKFVRRCENAFDLRILKWQADLPAQPAKIFRSEFAVVFQTTLGAVIQTPSAFLRAQSLHFRRNFYRQMNSQQSQIQRPLCFGEVRLDFCAIQI